MAAPVLRSKLDTSDGKRGQGFHMELILVLAGLAIGALILSRLVDFLLTFVWLAAAIGVVVLLAIIGGAVWGWGATLAIIGIASYLWIRPGKPPPPATGRFGYGPGDIMPPSPKRSDGSPF